MQPVRVGCAIQDLDGGGWQPGILGRYFGRCEPVGRPGPECHLRDHLHLLPSCNATQFLLAVLRAPGARRDELEARDTADAVAPGLAGCRQLPGVLVAHAGHVSLPWARRRRSDGYDVAVGAGSAVDRVDLGPDQGAALRDARGPT